MPEDIEVVDETVNTEEPVETIDTQEEIKRLLDDTVRRLDDVLTKLSEIAANTKRGGMPLPQRIDRAEEKLSIYDM